MAEPDQEITEHPLFTLNVPGAGGEWAPRTLEEVREWLAAETKAWEWLRVIPRPDSITNAFAAIQFAGDSEMNSWLSRLASQPERQAELVPQIQSQIDRRYNIEHALFSRSPAANYVLSLSERDPKIAAHVGYILIGRDPEASRAGYIASALAASYMFGPAAVPESAAASWAQIVDAITASESKMKASAGAAADVWRARRDDIANLHNHQRGEFDKDQSARQEGFANLQSEHAEKMKNIEASFKAGLTMSSAVHYFDEKSEHHGKKARTFAWWGGASGALIAGGVVLSAFLLGDDPKPAKVGVALALAFLALWLLRVLVRLFFSNSHLSTDMKTRATLVKTYLALIQEGGGIADKDRARIVDLVFRPANDGLVKEDGAPPTLFSMFQRGATGG